MRQELTGFLSQMGLGMLIKETVEFTVVVAQLNEARKSRQGSGPKKVR